jgi:hypothetical protein
VPLNSFHWLLSLTSTSKFGTTKIFQFSSLYQKGPQALNWLSW